MLPLKFFGRARDRGMVVEGSVLQVKILVHRSVGEFVS